jgi:hypothetical protein
MTALFVHSLQRLPSLQATVVSNAANMLATVSAECRRVLDLQLSVCVAFVDSLHKHLTAATLHPSFLWQGLLGHLLFAEALTPRWALGLCMVLSGLLLISHSIIAASPAAPGQGTHSTTSSQAGGDTQRAKES